MSGHIRVGSGKQGLGHGCCEVQLVPYLLSNHRDMLHRCSEPLLAEETWRPMNTVF